MVKTEQLFFFFFLHKTKGHLVLNKMRVVISIFDVHNSAAVNSLILVITIPLFLF